ncbi:MAG: glycoside hydrolase family 44 protein, partial [Anaerolineales bacterium]
MLLVVALPLALLSLAFPAAARPRTANLTIYADTLSAGWNDWSWDPITRDLASAAPVHAGSAAIAVTYTDGWGGLKLAYPDGLDSASYGSLRFWVHGGGSGGQHITVQLEGSASGDGAVITPTANNWSLVELPLAALGEAGEITAIDFFNSTAGAQPVFYLDDIELTPAGPPTPPPPPGAGPALSVNAAAGLHSISPDIYGLNFADPALAADIDLPVNRWGGNATTRYNWQLDISNRASDWFFENIDNDNAQPEQLPNGSASDQFVDQNAATGSATLLTVPLIGWTPKGPREANPRPCGFSTSQFASQQALAPDAPCGNGRHPDGTPITGNNPLDTSIA